MIKSNLIVYPIIIAFCMYSQHKEVYACSLVPILFQCYTQKRGKVWLIWWCQMMSHGCGLNWPGRGLDFLVALRLLPMHARARVQSNWPSDLPYRHFCNLPELNRRHCQKMNEDALGSRRRPLLAMLDFILGKICMILAWTYLLHGNYSYMAWSVHATYE